MITKTKQLTGIILVLAVAFCPAVMADYAKVIKKNHHIVSVKVEQSYILGDNETRIQAKEMLLKEAKKKAVRATGNFLRASRYIHNGKLIDDRINIISAHLITVKNTRWHYSLTPKGHTKISVTLNASVDNKVLDAQLKNLEDERKVTQKIDALLNNKSLSLQKQLATIKQLILNKESHYQHERLSNILKDMKYNIKSQADTSKNKQSTIDVSDFQKIARIEALQDAIDEEKDQAIIREKNIKIINQKAKRKWRKQKKKLDDLAYFNHNLPTILAVKIKNSDYPGIVVYTLKLKYSKKYYDFLVRNHIDMNNFDNPNRSITIHNVDPKLEKYYLHHRFLKFKFGPYIRLYSILPTFGDIYPFGHVLTIKAMFLTSEAAKIKTIRLIGYANNKLYADNKNKINNKKYWTIDLMLYTHDITLSHQSVVRAVMVTDDMVMCNKDYQITNGYAKYIEQEAITLEKKRIAEIKYNIRNNEKDIYSTTEFTKLKPGNTYNFPADYRKLIKYYREHHQLLPTLRKKIYCGGTNPLPPRQRK